MDKQMRNLICNIIYVYRNCILYAQQTSVAKFLFESLKVQNTPFGKTPVVLNGRCSSSFKNLQKKLHSMTLEIFPEISGEFQGPSWGLTVKMDPFVQNPRELNAHLFPLLKPWCQYPSLAVPGDFLGGRRRTSSRYSVILSGNDWGVQSLKGSSTILGRWLDPYNSN